MKEIGQALVVAFSMYSKIPMPSLIWTEKNMRYALCFFPLISLPIALLEVGWLVLCRYLSLSVELFAAVATVLPVLVTGGIHLDGFCDTCDALASHRPQEDKLRILKDAHLGAFAVIGCALYFLLTFGLWTELVRYPRAVLVFCIGLGLERALSGLSVLCFPCAKKEGLAQSFASAADKKGETAALITEAMVFGVVMLLIWPLCGAFCLALAGLVFLYYRRLCRRQFGGVTGDLAGWFLQCCELSLLAAAVIGGKIGCI